MNFYIDTDEKRGMEFPKDIDGEPAQSWGRDVRLLVVDDEEFLRAVIRKRLEIEGFSVGEAQSGKEALAKLGKEDYSILLTDIRMPEMDGIVLLREVSRRFPDTAGTFSTRGRRGRAPAGGPVCHGG